MTLTTRRRHRRFFGLCDGSFVLAAAAALCAGACGMPGPGDGGGGDAGDGGSMCAIPPPPSDAGDGGDAGDAARDAPAPPVDAGAPDATDGGDASAADVVAQPAELGGGEAVTCARAGNGAVRCWGDNTFAQLASPTPPDQLLAPAGAVPGVADVAELAVGSRHVCARTQRNAVLCWGRNAEGQLGRGRMTATEAQPAEVPCLPNAVEVATGGSHTCARLMNGTVLCWGFNSAGQLGDGSNAARSLPVMVPLPGRATQLALGVAHTCALLEGGDVMCWGDNSFGQVGQAAGPVGVRTPTMVAGASGAAEVAAGGYHTCVRAGTGVVACWGRNNAGQLGDGTQMDRAAPTAVAGLMGATQLALGVAHSCALRMDGTAQCWGWNSRGQIADPAMPFRATAAPVVGLAGATSVAAGWLHTCARLMNGTAVCWGANDRGQLGDGTQMDRVAPTPVMF